MNKRMLVLLPIVALVVLDSLNIISLAEKFNVPSSWVRSFFIFFLLSGILGKKKNLKVANQAVLREETVSKTTAEKLLDEDSYAFDPNDYKI